MTKKILSLLFFFTAAIALVSFTGKNPPRRDQRPVLGTIIIDAGHGGADPGAHGLFSNEADVALAIAMKLGRAVQQELPDIKVIYTRTTDMLPGGGNDIKQALRTRAQIANQAKGDLFISIHCNAAGPRAGGWYAKRVVGHKKRTAYVGRGKKRRKTTVNDPIYQSYYVKNTQHGTETYIWAADRSGFKGDAITLSEEEGGEDVEDSTNVLDLNSPEARIRAQLYEKKFFAKSLLLATYVEDEFVGGGRDSRGVKQRNEKGIWVLQATGMPSILIETGFITNKEEEDYINSDKGQEEIVNSIIAALKKYKSSLESSKSTGYISPLKVSVARK